MKLPGIGGDDEKEKAKKDYEEKMMIKDSMQTSGLEKQALANKEKNQSSSNELLNPDRDKQRIKQLLLNVKPVQYRPTVYMCSECGYQHQEKTGKCDSCGAESVKAKKGQPEMRWVDAEGDKLINTEGFNKIVWSEIESAINVSVSGGYLSSGQISKLNYSTLSTITQQLALYWYKYGVQNPNDMQQIGDIIRHPLLANTSKARGGRGLRNQESTRVEKFVSRFSDKDDEKGGKDGIF